MSDLQMKQMVLKEYPFLSDEQYNAILELIIEIEANITVDTFVALMKAFYCSR